MSSSTTRSGAGVDLGVYSAAELAAAQAAARATGVTARLHLKADTGLSRGGATPDDWPALCAAARQAEADGSVRVVGLWSHFAHADAGPDHPFARRQVRGVHARRSRWPSGPGCVPTSATSPTAPPPSPPRTRTSTWCGPG